MNKAPEKAMTLDQRIAALQPGESITIGLATTAERSSDGKILRFVRDTATGFVVLKTCKF